MSRPRAVVRDSAGIRIVAHPPEPIPQHRLGREPRATVGAGGSDTLALFRVVGAALAGHEFLLADAGNYRILRFALDGSLLGAIGRRGDGPGEFQQLGWVQPRGAGGVTVYDGRTRRITVLDQRGALIESWAFLPERDDPLGPNSLIVNGAPLAALDNGRVIAFPSGHAERVGQPGTLLPAVGNLRLYGRDLSVLRELGPIEIMRWYENPPTERRPVGNVLEGSRLLWSANAERLAVNTAGAHRVRVFDAGILRLIVVEQRARLAFEPDSIPASYAAAADSLPAYRAVKVDSEQRIWVKPSVRETADSMTWRFFERDGIGGGSLPLPGDAAILDATSTLLLLLRVDEFGTESVELWDFPIAQDH